MTNYGYFRLQYLTDIFSKMNDVILSLQGKQLTVFVANDKIWVLKWTLELLKTRIYHFDHNHFPIPKKATDEIGGDTNRCIFLILHSETC